jgi:hypothetical protein
MKGKGGFRKGGLGKGNQVGPIVGGAHNYLQKAHFDPKLCYI